MRRAVRLTFVAALALVCASCAPRGLPRITLPSGPATSAPDYADALADARGRCHDVRSYSAALSMSGRAGTQKLRGRVLAGLVPGALRLEAPAPAGGTVFILVADGTRGRLLLAQERRALEDARPADILDALVGIALGPDDLRALLSGCLLASPEPTGARAYGADWIVVDLTGGGSMYLRRGADRAWRIAVGTYDGLTVQYGGSGNALPARIRITAPAAAGRAAVDVGLSVSQLEVNGDLPRDRLVALAIPPGTVPMTLEELREHYRR